MKQNLSKWTAILVFVGLMITSCVTLTAQTPTQNDITAHYAVIPLTKDVKATMVSTQRIAPLGGDDITGGDFNETHPGFAADSTGLMVAGYEATLDGVTYDPYFASSDDWTSTGTFDGVDGFDYVQISHKSTGFYGTMSPNQDPSTSADANVIDFTQDPWQWLAWDLSAAPFYCSGFQFESIGTYTHAGPNGDQGAWNWGGIAYTGYNGYQGANINGCPFILYPITDKYGGIGWLTGTGATGCLHTADYIDAITNMSYAVYDRFDGAQWSLIVRKDDFGKWVLNSGYYYHSFVTSKSITDTGNVKNPDVVADNNTVLIVAQNDKSGSQDIYCYRSTNGFATNTPIVIANSTSDELYPKITLLGNTAVCTYIKDNQTYYKASTDGGLTWGAEALANTDDLIKPVEYGANDLCSAGTTVYSAWQDGSGANLDIYVNGFYTISAPIISIGTISGGIGKVTAQVMNIGTGPATNVDWTLTVTGGILSKINKVGSGTIDTLAAGASKAVSTPGFIMGLGSINIKATAGDATKTATGKVLLFFVHGIA